LQINSLFVVKLLLPSRR